MKKYCLENDNYVLDISTDPLLTNSGKFQTNKLRLSVWDGGTISMPLKNSFQPWKKVSQPFDSFECLNCKKLLLSKRRKTDVFRTANDPLKASSLLQSQSMNESKVSKKERKRLKVELIELLDHHCELCRSLQI